MEKHKLARNKLANYYIRAYTNKISHSQQHVKQWSHTPSSMLNGDPIHPAAF